MNIRLPEEIWHIIFDFKYKNFCIKICNVAYEYSCKNGVEKLNNKYTYSKDIVKGCLFLKLNVYELFQNTFINNYIMYTCIRSPTIVPDLLKAGAKVNGSDDYGRTPLMFACKYSPSIVPVLFKAGAKVHSSNNDGLTPLMFACTY